MGFIDDNTQTLTCPACGKEMKKYFLQDSNVNIDICLDGKFLDYGELEKIRNQKIQEPMVWAELLEEDKTPKGNKRRLFFEKFVKRFI